MAYKLVPKDVPTPKKTMLYQEVLEDFVKGKSNSSLVSGTGKKPSTLHQGLMKARKAPEFAGVRVVRRHEEVYLVKS